MLTKGGIKVNASSKLLTCMLINVNYLLIELRQVDDNVKGESKQIMSPTEKIVCRLDKVLSKPNKLQTTDVPLKHL